MKALDYLIWKFEYAIMKWGTSDFRKELKELKEKDYNRFIERREEIKAEVDRRIEEIGNVDDGVTETLYELFGIIV